ncbi:MAG: aspartate kinase [Dehalococcoidia bacterium]|nr:aspartate kinase [Dehalococcoidia bacterium]
MTLVVSKYGGSSLADARRITRIATRLAGLRRDGDDVVVVVSAMGKTTDSLIALARQITAEPEAREMDVLLSTGEIVSSTLMAMALKALGVPSISLTGAQAGIRTNSMYSRARIETIDPSRIRRELAAGKVVVVAGFQGLTAEDDVTTLGRGGSDTTAVALAAALGAGRAEIFTDVEGVYTADPRIEPKARPLREIGYEEMLELASQGARVMHPRAVEVGQLYDLPILVASSFGTGPGTLIRKETTMEAQNKARGIAHDTDVAKITVLGVPDHPGIAARLFEPLAEAGISVDTIVQNSSLQGLTDLSFTVARNDLARARTIVEPISKEIDAGGLEHDAHLGKVSVVGTGMLSAPGYAARMFRTLYEADVNIDMITTSEIRITCIISEDRVADAVRALHSAFQLDQP